jgi:hypothetical protein
MPSPQLSTNYCPLAIASDGNLLIFPHIRIQKSFGKYYQTTDVEEMLGKHNESIFLMDLFNNLRSSSSRSEIGG